MKFEALFFILLSVGYINCTKEKPSLVMSDEDYDMFFASAFSKAARSQAREKKFNKKRCKRALQLMLKEHNIERGRNIRQPHS